MRKLRISAISFLNTAPLMWDFEQGAPPINSRGSVLPPDLARDFEVEYTIPSCCAEALRAGTADIGIIPVAAFASIPELVILPDVAIAAKGPVRSILLVSKVPLEQVRTLAADTSSRTSVALAQVLFHKWFGQVPELRPAEPKLDEMLASCDAALLIGDPALRVDRSQYRTWDLAEEWRQLTGKPFVFAFWAMRLGALNEMRHGVDPGEVLRASRTRGLEPQHLNSIARQWAKHVGLSESDILHYLTQNISYALDTENVSGLELFFRYASECGAIEQIPYLRFPADAKASMAIL